VPALDTSKSFSVAAWVRLTDPTTYQTAVSKDGNQMSVFRLQYRVPEQSWCFSVRAKDVQDAGLATACAKTTSTGVWTHLAGVYDDNEMRLKLYVNGKLAASTAPTAAFLTDWAGGWNATGPVVVGRGLDAKTPGGVDYFSGQLADVQLFDRALVDQDLVGQRADDEHSNGFDEPGIVAPVQVGRWTFNQATWCYQAGIPDTCSAPDTAAWHRALTLTPGIETGEGVNDIALLLDATHFATGEPTQEYGYTQRDTAAGGGPPALQDAAVLRTDQAFTVSAWVRLDGATGKQTIVSQDTAGPGLSGFDLVYRDASWVLSMRNSPTATDASQSSSATAVADDPTTWHLLVGVFDPGAAQLRLYVDGDRVAAATTLAGLVPWQATGPLVVGRSDRPGGYADWMSGSLDNVTAWQGVLTDAAIHQLYVDESAEIATPN
jgi:Concanavalin A-like lectin/glucanases superfamily